MTVYSETPHRARVAPVSLGQLRRQRQQNALSQVSDTLLLAQTLIPLLPILQVEACKHKGRSKLKSSSTNTEVTYFPGWNKEEPWKELQLSESYFLLGVSLGVVQLCTMP